MTLRVRRIIYMSAIFLFFIVSAIAGLYASGYRLDASGQRLTKVGALYVKSYPTGASVVLDGKVTGKSTPARLLNVSPGTHTVELSKDTYYSWKKNLSIVSGQTTFIRDVVLFKASPQEQILSNGGDNLIISDSKELYAFISTNNELRVTNVRTRNSFILTIPVQPDTLFTFSPSNNEILFASKKRLYIVDINTEKISNVAPLPNKFTRLQWDKQNQAIIWILANNTLSKLDTSTSISQKFMQMIDDFFVVDGYLITMNKSQQSARFTVQSLTNAEDQWQTTISTLETTLLTKYSSPTTLIIQGSKTLWIVSKDAPNDAQVFDAYHFDIHNDLMLMTNDFEITMYSLSQHASTLIDRSGTLITDVAWHPNGSYFVRFQNDRADIIELDGRDVRNTSPLFQHKQPISIVFDQKGETAFILTDESQRVLAIQ